MHQLRPKPTEGELHLLKFLSENLDNNYEIYFQPFLNGDRPDIILMRPDAGVMIFEVKDWNLGSYDINDKKHWFVTQDHKKWSRIKSPIDQVLSYKQNLYDLHIENSNPWGVVSCAIYFHCENYDKVDNFLTGKFQDDENERYRRFLSHLVILGKDSLNRNSLNQFLRKHYLHRQSRFFNDTLYKSFKRHLQPPYHSREEGKPIEYTSKQQELINSPVKQRKIKGVAGSGKTCILAKRAVNALKIISSSVSSSPDNHPNILILTYNITLKNYIHDKISQVREDFSWGCFYIKNYHDFITRQ
ncbi:NERD domain-containing protein [Dolichospermum flos-aquae UHCC 0037]|uniref:NERD domain-containing protein n=1 Tax=Dolichospermum flos-aquae UHCC 0037 TaxID=2590026 RepID=A0ACC7SBP4_DOLFA|nr:NERD domain-containing protein [Dolichospermum flos-aquae UHCC 0037]